MSGKTPWNPYKELHQVGWNLATNDLGLGRTCLVQELDMFG
jgi:hypothetical protein